MRTVITVAPRLSRERKTSGVAVQIWIGNEQRREESSASTEQKKEEAYQNATNRQYDVRDERWNDGTEDMLRGEETEKHHCTSTRVALHCGG